MQNTTPTDMQPAAAKQHIVYFDSLRVLAAFSVVMLHMSGKQWLLLDYRTATWQIHHLFNGFTRWAVPVFVMMSGAVLLDPVRKQSTARLYHKNILRMILTYLGWSAFYALVGMVKQGGFSITYFIGEVIRGHYHLWFLLMIASLYVLIPILRKITEDRALLRYGLLVGAVVLFLIPRSLDLLSRLEISMAQKISASLSEVFESTVFGNGLVYVLYFILGYYLHTEPFSKRMRIILCAGGIVGFLLTFLLTNLASAAIQAQTAAYYAPETVNVLLMSTGMFTFGRFVLSRLPLQERPQKMVQLLSRCCLTIYLIHVFVLDTVGEWGLTTISFHPIISISALSLLVFLLSLAAALLLEGCKAAVRQQPNAQKKNA